VRHAEFARRRDAGSIRPVATDAVPHEEREALLCRVASFHAPQARALGHDANAGRVEGPHIEHAGFGIRGGAAPIGASRGSRDLDVIPAPARRREDTLIAGVQQDQLQARRFLRVKVWVQVFHGKLLPRKGRRLGGERLRGPNFFPGHVRTLRHGPLFDRPQGLACHPVEHIKHSRFCGLRDDVDHLAAVANR
jgi:hypothetical protein